MLARTLHVEDATPESIAPFGAFIGVHQDLPLFAQWAGVSVYAAIPVEIGQGGEVLHVRMMAAAFPARVALLERHFKHTQTYLSANGRSFVMVLGTATTADGLPDVSGLRAFLFKDGAGIAMKPETWHEFPLALEDDTRFTVLLRAESHVNLLETPEYPSDARGPDLERYDMLARADVFVRLGRPIRRRGNRGPLARVAGDR